MEFQSRDYVSFSSKELHQFKPSLLEKMFVLGVIVPSVVIGVQTLTYGYSLYEKISGKIKDFPKKRIYS